MKMKNYILIILAMLVGCASPNPTVIGKIDKSKPLDFTVKDIRPEIESKTGPLTTNALNNSYGITRMGEGVFSPNIVEYLTYRLQEGCGHALKGKEVTVVSVTLYYNLQKAAENDYAKLSSVPLGVLDVAVIRAIKGKKPISKDTKIENYQQLKELNEGWYLSSENPSDLPADIVNIAVKIDNKEYFSRQVRGSSFQDRKKSKNDENFVSAINIAIDQIISSINKDYEKQ
jgi:hypothetical protein